MRMGFTFKGFDKDVEFIGGEWASFTYSVLARRIAFHLGGDSGFIAEKKGNSRF